jgi:hypothetical protein
MMERLSLLFYVAWPPTSLSLPDLPSSQLDPSSSLTLTHAQIYIYTIHRPCVFHFAFPRLLLFNLLVSFPELHQIDLLLFSMQFLQFLLLAVAAAAVAAAKMCSPPSLCVCAHLQKRTTTRQYHIFISSLLLISKGESKPILCLFVFYL